MLGFFSRGLVFMVESVMWPIFIFLTFSDLISVGIAAALSGIGITFFTLFIGRLSDKISKSMLVRIGGLGYAFVWFARMFVTTELEVFILALLGGVFMSTIAVSMFSSFSNIAKKEGGIVSNVNTRELWLTIGRVAGLVILILMLGDFQFAFGLAAVVSLLLLAF
jgi:MFS family permease